VDFWEYPIGKEGVVSPPYRFSYGGPTRKASQQRYERETMNPRVFGGREDDVISISQHFVVAVCSKESSFNPRSSLFQGEE